MPEEHESIVFNEETIRAFQDLGHLLRRILARLVKEGKVVVIDGKICDPITKKPLR